MTSILMAIVGIGFLIFIHELGHYICARLAGVRVQVFSLGFGQRVWGFVWKGTDYRLSLVPFGGYVRVAGEDPTRRDFLRPDDLYAKGYDALQEDRLDQAFDLLSECAVDEPALPGLMRRSFIAMSTAGSSASG